MAFNIRNVKGKLLSCNSAYVDYSWKDLLSEEDPANFVNGESARTALEGMIELRMEKIYELSSLNIQEGDLDLYNDRIRTIAELKSQVEDLQNAFVVEA